VGTGSAIASGNVSATTISLHQSSEVRDMGIDVSTQVGGVANVGAGVANTGLNAAIGNASGAIAPGGGPGTPNSASATQSAQFESVLADPASPVTVLGPLTAANDGQVSNASDGDACVCTGNAVASGNVSTTNLIQDLDTSVGTGAIVLTEAGGVLNAGLGLANTGLNAALGNISQNDATATQTNTVTTGIAPGDVVGPQTVHSGGGASNASNGTGKVGTGNARATGNESTTNFVQAAAADSDLAVATLSGGTSNTGLGLANSGLNLGVGNASTNSATLTQTADGAGIVSSVGTASNTSDGQGLVGNPDCLVPGAPGGPSTPGTSSLPKTGAPVEVEAAIGLMLLLAGFGLRRKSASLA
jgi:LPXTG-motif cell wall-anchored protein